MKKEKQSLTLLSIAQYADLRGQTKTHFQTLCKKYCKETAPTRKKIIMEKMPGVKGIDFITNQGPFSFYQLSVDPVWAKEQFLLRGAQA